MSRHNVDLTLGECILPAPSTKVTKLLSVGASGDCMLAIGYSAAALQGLAGYHAACLLIDTITTGGTALHVNTGTGDSANFITVAT